MLKTIWEGIGPRFSSQTPSIGCTRLLHHQGVGISGLGMVQRRLRTLQKQCNKPTHMVESVRMARLASIWLQGHLGMSANTRCLVPRVRE